MESLLVNSALVHRWGLALPDDKPLRDARYAFVSDDQNETRARREELWVRRCSDANGLLVAR